MRIGLLYAMRGEIESLLTAETPLLQEKAGAAFYRIRKDILACCGGVGKVNAAMPPSCSSTCTAPTSS